MPGLATIEAEVQAARLEKVPLEEEKPVEVLPQGDHLSQMYQVLEESSHAVVTSGCFLKSRLEFQELPKMESDLSKSQLALIATCLKC